MPSKIDLYQIGVWFSVGFFTGAGWAIAANGHPAAAPPFSRPAATSTSQ
jgi:hypothetical protein